MLASSAIASFEGLCRSFIDKKPLRFCSATTSTQRTTWTSGVAATPTFRGKAMTRSYAGIPKLPSDWSTQIDATPDWLPVHLPTPARRRMF